VHRSSVVGLGAEVGVVDHIGDVSVWNTLRIVEQRRWRPESDDPQYLALCSRPNDSSTASDGDLLAERQREGVGHSVFLVALL
jgi:hypothetical protein